MLDLFSARLLRVGALYNLQSVPRILIIMETKAIKQTIQEQLVDTLATQGDEGRDKLR